MRPTDQSDSGKSGLERRRQAEEILRKRETGLAEMSPEDVRGLFHELQVHQIELELQNEELRRSQLELIEARDRYSDLYEFAPVGYLTLAPDGAIEHCNLTGEKMLKMGRKDLPGLNFAKFIAPESQDHWYLYRRAVFAEEPTVTCELEMRTSDGEAWWARLESVVMGEGGERRIRAALLDVTEQREGDLALEALNVDRSLLLERRTEQLRESVSRIKLLMEAISNLGEGVVITTDRLDWPGPEIVFVNEAMCRITGYSSDELIGQTPRLLHGTATDRALLDRIKGRLAHGESCLEEVTNYRKDGTRYDAEIFITPLVDEQGRRTNYVSIHRDITDRKEKERSLRERQEKLQAIMDAAVDAIVTIDRAGVIMAVNRATERIFGYSESEMLGQNVRMLMASPYREKHDDHLAEYRETGEAHIIEVGREVKGRRKNGEVFPVDLSVSKVDGLGLYTGIVRDIAERKEAEVALQREHRFREEIIKTARAIILVLDGEGRIMSFNPYFEELSGWPLEEAKGRDWFATFLSERDRGRGRALFKEAMAGRTSHSEVSSIRTKKGAELIVEWFNAVLTDEAGGVTGLLCTGTDITERQILEQQVIHAAEEERERIARDLHDDLGSLLTGIKLGAEGLVTALTREGSEHAEKGSAAVQQIVEAITKTRAIARGLRPVGSDPEDLVPTLRGLRERVTAGTGWQFRFECREPVLVDDPVQANHLYRIAQEAVTNALKHSDGTEILIRLRKSGGMVELTVEDNGRGFDFAEGGSSGLGLHIMRYRSDAMKGVLEVARGESGGTKVTCTVPGVR